MPTPDDCIRNHGGPLERDLYDAVRGEPDPTLAMRRRQAQLAQQKRQKGLQAIALHQAEQQVRKHSHGIDSGLASLLTRDLWGEGAGQNVEFKAKAIMAQAYAEWAEGMSRFRSKAAGLRQDQDGLRQMVRALFGQDVGDGDVQRLAGLWRDVADGLRERFNQAGGDIGKIENWGLPQYHDAKRVNQFGTGTADQKRAAWKDFIRPLLDRERMLNDDGARLSDIEFETALDTAYDRIRTDGLSDLKPGASGGKKLANKRADHRFLIFRDGDAWLRYHDQFGHQDIYTTMTDHIMGMSHDIAMLETLGPNPNASYRYLRDLVRKDFAPGGRLEDKRFHNTRLQYLDSVWNVVSGNVGKSPNPNLADFANSVRHTLVAAKLGGAFLSAFSDLTFQAMTRRFNGLPAANMLGQMLKQMNPANEADRLFAVKLGLGADAWLNHSMVANRFSDVYGANWASKISDFTMRASLLSSWTDAGRKAFGLEFSNFMAEHRGLSWADLGRKKQTRAFRSTLERGGITPDEWDVFRGLTPLEYKGVEYLRPADIIDQADALGYSERAANDLAAKYLGMMHTEMDFAVPTPDARARAITTGGGAAAGTWSGEAARALFQFKSFPITVLLQTFYRAASQPGGVSKAKYAATAFIGTTVIGALAMQAKEMSRGKDPRPMDDPKFWAAAAMQGGGAGIVGDFLFSPESRFGQDPLTTLLGPSVGLAGDTLSLTLDNAKQFAYGEDVDFARDVVRFMRQYTPGSSIWYARLAIEREIFDQLDLMADQGNARKAWRRMLRKRQKEYGQGYWWRPGESALWDDGPDRAPDLGNIAP